MKFIKPKGLLITALCLLLSYSSIFGQEKYLDKKGELTFEASEALFEEVKATNVSVTAVFNAENNEIAALALMKGFRFKNSLMEEHFNENYIESETYPKAIFRGKIIAINSNELTAKKVEAAIEGTLEVHGVKKDIQSIITIQKVGDTISLIGSFEVSPQDFEIEIPKIVRNKIAKTVTVRFDFKLVKKS